MFAPPQNSIMAQDPRGRLDIAAVRLAHHFMVKAHPRAAELWNSGLGDLVEGFVQDAGIPARAFSAVDLARAIGLLKPAPKPGKGAGGNVR